MAIAATLKSDEVLDFDALAQDAWQKVREAEAVEARLSLDALHDPEVASELRAVQSERAAAEVAVRQVELARADHARREDEAREQAEIEAQEKALKRATALQSKIDAEALKFDAEANQLAHAALAHRKLTNQQRELAERGGVTPPAGLLWGISPYEGALRRATTSARVD